LQEGYDYKRPKRGEYVTGTIIELRPEALIVDIGVKRDGFVPAHDLRKLDDEVSDNLEVGDEVPLFIERSWNRDGELILSLSRGKELDDWKEAQRLLESGEVVELQITGKNKGGVTVDFGQLRGFIPASHLNDIERGLSQEERQTQLAGMIGHVIRAKVIEVDQSRRRLVLSQRKGELAYRRKRKKELLETLSVGDVVSGKVTSLKNFGAFVDIGGTDGLVHVSEIARERVKHPADRLKVGQELQVKVISLDTERNRIGLSIKRLLPDAWADIYERYYAGQVVEATITNVVDFGAFARLEAGVEGLIHVSQMSHDHIEHPSALVSPGDEVLVRIIRIEPQRRRIGLSLKDVPQWVDSATAEALDEAMDEEDSPEATPEAEPEAEMEEQTQAVAESAEPEPAQEQPSTPAAATD
jgi:small subunit ribosomal protein S1